MTGRFLRQYLIPLVFLAALLVAALAFKQVRAVLTILTIFPPWAVALIVAIVLLTEVVKTLRWQFFVRASGIALPLGDAATSYLAAQAASVLPGSDLVRVRLAVEHGVPPRVGLTVSFAMWATDMMALPLLALAGYGKQLVARWVLFLPLAVPVALLLLVRSRRFACFVSRTLARYRLTRRYALSDAEIAHVTHLLTRRRVIVGGIGYAAVMRLLFAGTLVIVANVINDQPLRYETILSAQSLSTLAGALPLLSNAVSIGSLVELLHTRGVSRALGFLITLTNQLTGMTINVAIGLVVLLLRYPALLSGKVPTIPDPSPASLPAVVEPSTPGRNAEGAEQESEARKSVTR